MLDLEHPDPTRRLAAVYGLLGFPDPEVRERLHRVAEEDPDFHVRTTAADELALVTAVKVISLDSRRKKP